MLLRDAVCLNYRTVGSTCDDRAACQDTSFTNRLAKAASQDVYCLLQRLPTIAGRNSYKQVPSLEISCQIWKFQARGPSVGALLQQVIGPKHLWEREYCHLRDRASACCYSRCQPVAPSGPSAASTECLRRPVPSIHATKHRAV